MTKASILHKLRIFSNLASGLATMGLLGLLGFSAAAQTAAQTVAQTVAQTTTQTLVVHTYESMVSQWGLGPQIKEAFESKCSCRLKFVTFPDGGSLLTRLIFADGNSEADVILGLDNFLLPTALDSGAFAPHGLDLGKVDWRLPDQLAEQFDGKWSDTTFIPYDLGFFAFVGRRSHDYPSSLRALAERSDILIAAQDPRSSTPGLGLALWLETLYGDDSVNVWRDMVDHVAVFTPGWSEAYALFIKDEVDIVMSYSTSPTYHELAESDENYQWLEFDEGHLMQVELAGITKASKQKPLARLFLETLLAPDVQGSVAQTNWMFPVTDIPIDPAFSKAWPRKVINVPSGKIKRLRGNAIASWIKSNE